MKRNTKIQGDSRVNKAMITPQGKYNNSISEYFRQKHYWQQGGCIGVKPVCPRFYRE